MFTRLSGSSWFKIKLNGKVIHIDPGYTGYFKSHGLPMTEFEEPGDLILITHAHKDHLQLAALDKIRKHGSIILAPKVCKDIINTQFRMVKPGDETKLEDFTVQVVHAYNTPEGHSTMKAHHMGDGVGYIVQIKQKTIYHSGDTDFIPEMKSFPPIDIALLPIGGTYTMDISEAVQAVLAIQPKIVIPMHFLKADPDEFKRQVESKSHVEVLIIQPGQSINI